MNTGEYVDISIAMQTIEQAYNELLANANKFKNYSNALIKSDVEDEQAKVSLNTYRQVVWERNVAINQLKELGFEFGENMSDAVSREDVGKIRQIVDDYFLIGKRSGYDCIAEIDKIVNPIQKV